MTTIVAYVDPGSGLMAFQAIAAVFCSIALSLKRTRAGVASLFRLKVGSNKPKE